MGNVVAGKALQVRGAEPMRPYLRTKNVLDGRIDIRDVLRMPMTDSEFDRFRIVRGDVLLNEGQTLDLVGRCSIYSGEFGSPCAMQNQLLRFRARPETSPDFAAHLFRYCQRNGTFSTIATQTTSVAHLGSSRLADLILRWPLARAEQVAIAEVLTDVDDLITTLERLIAKKEAVRQGMMQQLLTGKTRLPGFTEPWRAESTVAEEFEVQLGKRLDAAVNHGTLRVCINNRGVRWGRVLASESVLAPLTTTDIRELRLESNDVLVCEGGDIGRASVWHDELPEAYFLNTLHRLRSKGRYDPHLLVAFLERWVNTGELTALVGKSSLAHLTKENLLRLALPMPPIAEQEAIAAVLDDADREIHLLRARLEKARVIKTGMMQELLTGRTRLPVLDGAA